jgi:CsoR family transcriptional regulator, copper-sensing transcriptional repressor
MHTHPYKKMIDRLSRAEGQIRALRTLLESEKPHDCKKFITQVKAARSALKGVSEEYVIHHIHTCAALSEKRRNEEINEAIKLLAHD